MVFLNPPNDDNDIVSRIVIIDITINNSKRVNAEYFFLKVKNFKAVFANSNILI